MANPLEQVLNRVKQILTPASNAMSVARMQAQNLGPSAVQRQNAMSIGRATLDAPKAFAQTFYNNTAPLGSALGYGLREAVYKPFGIADSQLYARQNQTNINASRLAKTPQAKQRLLNEVPQMMRVDAQKAQDLRNAAPGSAAKTALTLIGAGAPGQMLAGAGVGGTLNAGLTALQGGNVAQAFGEGAAQALPYAGVNRLTSPFWNAVTNDIVGNSTSALGRRLVSGTVMAGGNVAENSVTTPLLEGRMPTLSENLIAGGAGFGFGAAIPVKANAPVKTMRQQLEIIASDQLRVKGQYAQNDELRRAAKIVLGNKPIPKDATPKFVKLINQIKFELKNSELSDLVPDPKGGGMIRTKLPGFIDPSAKVGGEAGKTFTDWNGKPLGVGDSASYATKWGNAEGKIVGFKETKLGTQAEVELPDHVWNRMKELPAYKGKNKPKTTLIEIGNLNETGTQSTPLEALQTEARKYKSAEEFIKAVTNRAESVAQKVDPNYDYASNVSATDGYKAYQRETGGLDATKLANLYNQATTPKVGGEAPNPAKIKQRLAQELIDVDSSDTKAVRGSFVKAGYVEVDGFLVHPSVDAQWVKDLSPETKQLMKDKGITYIDNATGGQSGVAVERNLGGNKLRGIAVRSDAEIGSNAFTKKDAVVAHEVGHFVWRDLTPEQQAAWTKEHPQSESAYIDRLKSGEQHSGGSIAEENFSENYSKATLSSTPLEALQTEARKYKSAEEFIQSQKDMLAKLLADKDYLNKQLRTQNYVGKADKTKIIREIRNIDTGIKATQNNLVYIAENPTKVMVNTPKTDISAWKSNVTSNVTPQTDLYNQATAPKVEAPNLTQQLAETVTGKKLRVRPSPTVEAPPIKPLTEPDLTGASVSPETSSYLRELNQSQANARKGTSNTLSNILMDVKRKLVDSVSPIEDIFASNKRAGITVKPSEDFSNAVDRSKRATVLATQFVKDNGLEDVVRNAPDINALDQYLIAKHAAEISTKTGRDAVKDQQLVAELAPIYEPFAQQVRNYTRSLLDYVTESGLISKETNALLKQKYPDYVPLNRIFAEGELSQKGFGAGPASLSKQTVVQKLKGSEREIQSPLSSLLLKTEDAFKQGERNKAGQILANNKNRGGFKGLITLLKPGDKSTGKSTFSIFRNGVKETYETTPEIAAAAKSLDATQLGIVGEVLAAPVRIARIGITGINAPFVLANIAKDQVTASINSTKALQTSVLNAPNFVKALWAALGHGKEYDNWVRSGAGGTSFDIARNAPELSLNRMRAQRNVGSKVAYTVTHPSQILRAVENVLSRGEELTRIQQFTGTRDALLKEGMSLADANAAAAKQSRTASTNFARSGDWGRTLNSVWLYLNAGIQGGRTLASSLRDRPAQTITKLALVGMTPVAMTTLWNTSDPDRKAAYDDIQDYEKDNNLIIVPNNPVKDPKTGKWNVIKVPLSQEVSNLSVPLRRQLESMSGAPGTNFAEVAAALVGTFTGANLTSPNAFLSQITPQALKPSLQFGLNKNIFTGNDVVPQYMIDQGLPPEMQVKDNTSGSARIVGKAINQSPLKVEQLVKDVFGGVGNQLINASDTVLNKAGVIPEDQIGGQSISEGVVSRFNQASGGQQLNNLYEDKPTTGGLVSTAQASDGNTLAPEIVENKGLYYVKIGKGVKSFDTPEEATLAVDKQKFKESDKNIDLIGDTVFRRSKDGNVTTMPKIDYETLMTTQKMENAKLSGDYKTWMDLAMNQAQNIQTQMQDPTLDDLEKGDLQQKLDALIESAVKYQGYGGFKKPKKAKAPPKMQVAKFAKSSFKMKRGTTKKSTIKTVASKKIAPPKIKVSRFKVKKA